MAHRHEACQLARPAALASGPENLVVSSFLITFTVEAQRGNGPMTCRAPEQENVGVFCYPRHKCPCSNGRTESTTSVLTPVLKWQSRRFPQLRIPSPRVSPRRRPTGVRVDLCLARTPSCRIFWCHPDVGGFIPRSQLSTERRELRHRCDNQAVVPSTEKAFGFCAGPIPEGVAMTGANEFDPFKD